MSIYPKVTEQGLISLREISEIHRQPIYLLKLKLTLKQTHDTKLAESPSLTTKKLDKINEPTRKTGEVITESISIIENNQEMVPVENESKDENIRTNPKAHPNSSVFRELITETLSFLMSSSKSKKNFPSRESIPGAPIHTLVGDKLRIRDNDYELTPKIIKLDLT